jgi:hypothetical protein
MMSAGVRNAARGTARVEGTQMLSTLQHHGDALSFTPLLSRDQFFLSRAEVDASTEQLQTLSSSALTGQICSYVFDDFADNSKGLYRPVFQLRSCFFFACKLL